MRKATKLSSKINKISSYVDTYDHEIRKSAEPISAAIMTGLAIYGIISMVSSFASACYNKAEDIRKVKTDLQYLVHLVDLQEQDGFGAYKDIFLDFKEYANKTISLIDEMIEKPKHTQDTEQIKKAQEFVEASQMVLARSTSVLGALNQLQTGSSNVGNFIVGLHIDFGADWTRWQGFSNALTRLNGALSTLSSQIELELKKAAEAGKAADAANPGAARAPTPGAAPGAQAPAPGAAGMASVVL